MCKSAWRTVAVCTRDCFSVLALTPCPFLTSLPTNQNTVKAAGADVDADVLAAAVEVCDTECDRLSLKLFNEYCKGDKQGRALELLDSMHTVKSMQGE